MWCGRARQERVLPHRKMGACVSARLEPRAIVFASLIAVRTSAILRCYAPVWSDSRYPYLRTRNTKTKLSAGESCLSGANVDCSLRHRANSVCISSSLRTRTRTSHTHVHTCMHTHTHTHARTHAHTRTHACTHAHVATFRTTMRNASVLNDVPVIGEKLGDTLKLGDAKTADDKWRPTLVVRLPSSIRIRGSNCEHRRTIPVSTFERWPDVHLIDVLSCAVRFGVHYNARAAGGFDFNRCNTCCTCGEPRPCWR